ncbi:Uncharacterized protein BWINRA5_06011 [Bacillus mycoides]|uniref:hypothetical protein n=1 Tax=Bacillus mycoides TaxID=1405 RepID=UPI0008177FE2|nr:hypothetical protein [Bacillus mycoides]SCB02533.1 Uncharacterized protein BWINRA5_06011 [Bacillus mycoides]
MGGIKLWIRLEKLPHSYRNSDKEEWRFVESDLLKLNIFSSVNKTEQQDNELKIDSDETELIKLAYQAVTLNSPTIEILSVLVVVNEGVCSTKRIDEQEEYPVHLSFLFSSLNVEII